MTESSRVNLFTALLFAFSLTAFSQSETSGNPKWGEAERRQHIQNTQDSTTWDLEKLEMDKQLIGLDMAGPFELAALPVPSYELTMGSDEVANGNQPGQFTAGDKSLYMNSFFVAKNSLNEDFLGERDDEIFFQILVVSPEAEPEAQSVIWSRNTPDFFGQGYVKTSESNIEYAAFITAERSSFAIVNTRIFHLNFGKTLLIYPQPDGTLRTLQVDSPPLSKSNVVEYSRELLQQDEVKDFLKIE